MDVLKEAVLAYRTPTFLEKSVYEQPVFLTAELPILAITYLQ